jgi:hypothetical protein
MSFFEAYQPASWFLLRLNDSQRCHLEMTYRTRAAAADGGVVVDLNGGEWANLSASDDWRTVKLDERVLNRGSNTIAITWPSAAGATEARIRRAAAQLRRSVLPNPLVEFGQLFRLRLVTAEASSAPGV